MSHADVLTPAREIEARIQRLRSRLREEGVDGALLVQNVDLFYFSGTLQQAHLYVPLEGPPLLLVRKSLERARSESPLERIQAISSPRELPDLLTENGLPLPEVLGLEMDVLPANLYLAYTRIFPAARTVDVSPAIRTVRAVKSPFEIERIRHAARMADEVAASLSTHIRPGMTEVELAGLVEAEARRRGHQGIVRMRMWGGEMFYGHLMAGPPAAEPSYLASPTGGAGLSPAVAQGAGFAHLRPEEPILLDYVFAWNGYIADHTRIFAIGGLPGDLVEAHGAMLAVQEAVKKAGRPGVPAGDLYALAVDTAGKLGYGEWFMGTAERRIRFVGHGVGLELDEYPFLAEGQRMPLEAGMVVALEPKLVIPGRGVVGIENTHLVTENGFEQLTGFDEAVQIL